MEIVMEKSSPKNCKTIVFLYFRLLKEKLNISVPVMPGRAIAGYCGRINSLKEREELTWEEYELFVETLFDIMVPKGFKPTFGAIVSSKVYHAVAKSSQVYNKPEEKSFQSLADLIYKSGKYAEVLK